MNDLILKRDDALAASVLDTQSRLFYVSNDVLYVAPFIADFATRFNVLTAIALLSTLRSTPTSFALAFGTDIGRIRKFTAQLLWTLRPVLSADVLVKKPRFIRGMGAYPNWKRSLH